MKIIVFIFLLTSSVHASTIEKYTGTATNKSGQVVYKENHTVTFDDQKNVQKASTRYISEGGKLLGTLETDFSKSLSAPTHIFTDARNGLTHGIRYKDKQIIMFLKKKDEPEKTKTVSPSIAGKNEIIIGGQGFHYYLVKNFDQVVSKKTQKIKMLIPGKLDYYTFILEYKSQDNDQTNFKVKIKSVFLRMFAPSLKLRYDQKTKHLVRYAGLSNIQEDNGGIQNVVIKYTYPAKKK